VTEKTNVAALPTSNIRGRRQDRRRAILAAASEMFLELGYGGATIDEVIRRIGGSKRTVYSYFTSKEALFVAVIDEIVGEIVRPLPDIDELALGIRETLLLVAEQHMTTVLSERHIALIRLVAAEATRFPEIGRAYYEHGPARGHAKLEQYFARQRRLGMLRLPDVRQAADFFWGMLLHHDTLRRLYDVEGPPSATYVKRACLTVVDAFLAQYATPAALERTARRRGAGRS